MEEKRKAGNMYLSYIQAYNNPKNRYQENMLALATISDRMLIEDPQEFINRLREKISEMHHSYPRCKKPTINTWNYKKLDSSDVGFTIDDFIFIHIIEIRGRFMEKIHIQPFLQFGAKVPGTLDEVVKGGVSNG